MERSRIRGGKETLTKEEEGERLDLLGRRDLCLLFLRARTW